jgi:hypothetical protein
MLKPQISTSPKSPKIVTLILSEKQHQCSEIAQSLLVFALSLLISSVSVHKFSSQAMAEHREQHPGDYQLTTIDMLPGYRPKLAYLSDSIVRYNQ